MNILFYLAGGNSARFGKQHKLFLPLNGKPLFLHALHSLLSPASNSSSSSPVHEFFMNFPRGREKEMKQWLPVSLRGRSPKQSLFPAGKTRQASVFLLMNEVEKLKQKPEFIIIHNAANPFATLEEVQKCLAVLKKNPAIDGVAVGRPLANTLKKITSAGEITTLHRHEYWETETPQVVRYKSFLEAHHKAAKEKFEATDDLALLEWLGRKTTVIPASKNNFKITTPRDYAFAQFLVGDFPHVVSGFGEDSHRFSRTHRGLKLGGLLFAHEPKLEADSDGDVILHALATALSQAVNQGSLGKFATPLFKKEGMKNSALYVRHMLKKVQAKKLSIEKINVMIEGKFPKIDPLAPKISASISKLLGIPTERVSIAAHTGENLSPFGKGEGLRCSVQILLTHGHKYERPLPFMSGPIS